MHSMRVSFLFVLWVALFLAMAPSFAADEADAGDAPVSTLITTNAPKSDDSEEVPPPSPSDLNPPTSSPEPRPAGVESPAPASASAPTTPCVPVAQCECPLRPQDQFWVIETSHLPWIDCQGFAPPNLGFSRFQCGSGTVQSNLAEFLAMGQDTNTVFYVPGNRVADGEAVRRGWIVYNSLSKASDDRPLRLVIWSWPSDRVRGLRRDVRLKADRASTEGLYLGWLLSQIDPAAQVSFQGFSFGSRIVCGALHAVQTGSLEGIPLPNYISHDERRPARVVLMAAATHNYWLLPGQIHGSAVARVDRMLLCFNPCDVALKHYQMVDKCERAAALGHTGFVDVSPLGEAGSRLRQLDVCCMVGKEHAELNYYGNGSIMALAAQYLLWRNIEE